MRVPIIAANWKMNMGRIEEALAFVRQIRYPLSSVRGVEKVLCPPFTVLVAVAEAVRPTSISIGAQNMHWEEQGAYTGEVSPSMLQPICQYVIVGHSERRRGSVSVSIAAGDEPLGVDTNRAVKRKVRAALEHGMRPIICVGENLDQNSAGATHEFVGEQVRAALEGLRQEEVEKCVLAYEPIWAIGTGKAATPADANRVIGLTIRGAVADGYGESVAQTVRVQYGGSVNAENIYAFMRMPEVDGALVGGASLRQDFVDLVRRAAEASSE